MWMGLLALWHGGHVFAEDLGPAYPVDLPADKVREGVTLAIEREHLQLTGEDLRAIPVHCEAGVTGVVLLGDGSFRFTPAGSEVIEGKFRAAMLRFHPSEQQQMVDLSASPINDLATREIARHLLNDVFRHCWHSGQDALLPPPGNLTAVLYSVGHGDLLISTGPDVNLVYDFTARKQLFTNQKE